MVLTELVHLLDSSTKSTFVYIFIVLLTDHRHKFYSISFFKSGMLLQQPIAPLEHVSAYFEYVLHHPQGNERTGDIRSS